MEEGFELTSSNFAKRLHLLLHRIGIPCNAHTSLCEVLSLNLHFNIPAGPLEEEGSFSTRVPLEELSTNAQLKTFLVCNTLTSVHLEGMFYVLFLGELNQ